MNLILFIVLAALFVVLTPGVLLKLPKNGSKMTVAVVHGLVFALVWTLSRAFIVKATSVFNIDVGGSYMEAMENGQKKEKEDDKKDSNTIASAISSIPGLSAASSSK
jgi:hypothetical protein